MASLLSLLPLIRHRSLIGCILIILLASTTPHATAKGYSRIFSFGDSLADTGNLLLQSRPSKPPHYAFYPYGETYFQTPTGRCCDGRLIIDFLATTVGLPFIPPYFEVIKRGIHSRADYPQGVNFAVAGATALDASFYTKRGLQAHNMSLGTQLKWFRELLPSYCSTPAACKELLGDSLILMGEIGGNDFNYPFLKGTNVSEIRDMVPLVVDAIGAAITELIDLGAKTLLVPGNLPIGCSAAYLTYFHNSTKTDYDPVTGCLTWLNEFADYQNTRILLKLDELRVKHPNTNIIYADYYNAALRIYRSPEEFGFWKIAVPACCGGGGPYNVNMTRKCGDPNVGWCHDPSKYVSWDGIHMTEAAYRLIANGISKGIYTIPRFNLASDSAVL